jgi:hypothetical protein
MQSIRAFPAIEIYISLNSVFSLVKFIKNSDFFHNHHNFSFYISGSQSNTKSFLYSFFYCKLPQQLFSKRERQHNNKTYARPIAVADNRLLFDERVIEKDLQSVKTVI